MRTYCDTCRAFRHGWYTWCPDCGARVRTIHAIEGNVVKLETAIETSINETRTVTVQVRSFSEAVSEIEELCADDDGEIDSVEVSDETPYCEVWNTGTFMQWRLKLVQVVS